jgi:acetyltransferase-like isoleucine patch superfamily enzyme
MINDFLSEQELKNLNFKKIGKKVLISKRAIFYNTKNTEIGNNVRIDAYSVFQNSNKLIIGNNSHISCHVFFCGCEKIILKGKNGIGPYVSIYSSINDFSSKKNDYLYKKNSNKIIIKKKKIVIEEFAIVGDKSIIFPGVLLRKGSAIASNSKVLVSTLPWKIYGHIHNNHIVEVLGKRK